MLDQNLARGLSLAVIALFFIYHALQLPVGSLTRAGPGMFPLIVSTLLLALAAVTLVQSRFVARVPLTFSVRSIGVIVLGLGVFVAASTFVNMAAGITLMVFTAGFAAPAYSWRRNAKISLALILIALAFQKLLGLNLRLI